MNSPSERRRPLLVTGAGGMLGGYFKGPRFLRTQKADLDVCDPNQIDEFFKGQRISGVIHCAAIANLEQCENNPDLAFAVNVQGSENIASACARYNIPMTHVSTAGVFAENPKGLFDEEDLPAPRCAYHRSKWLSEQVVTDILPNARIVRIGWLAGGGPQRDQKFIGLIMNKMLRQLAASAPNDDVISIANDTRGCILYAGDIAEPLWQLMRQPCSGIFHLVNSGVCSRWDIARHLALRLDPSGQRLRLRSVTSNDIKTSVARPASEAIYSRNLPALGIQPLRSWQEALDAYLMEWNVDTTQTNRSHLMGDPAFSG